MLDKTCAGTLESKTFHGSNPSLKLDAYCPHNRCRAFFLSAVVNRLPLRAQGRKERSRASAEVVPLAEWLPSPEGTPCERSGAAPTSERRFTKQRVGESCARSSPSIAHTFSGSTASNSGVISWSKTAPS